MTERGRYQAKRDLGEILLEGAFIRETDLKAAEEIVRRTGKKLTEVLLKEKLVTPETLATVLSFQYGVSLVDLKKFDIQPQALTSISETVAMEDHVLPLAVNGDVLTVAMEDPGKQELIDKLSTLSRKRVVPVIPLPGNLKALIDTHYRLINPKPPRAADVAEEIGPSAEPAAAQAGSEPALTPESVAKAPIIVAIDMILAQAVKIRASEIYFEPRGDDIRIRYRANGVFHDAVTLPWNYQNALLSRIKVMANMGLAERPPQQGQFSVAMGNKTVDFRVATAGTAFGESVILTIPEHSWASIPPPQVGVAVEVLEKYKHMLDQARRDKADLEQLVAELSLELYRVKKAARPLEDTPDFGAPKSVDSRSM